MTEIKRGAISIMLTIASLQDVPLLLLRFSGDEEEGLITQG